MKPAITETAKVSPPLSAVALRLSGLVARGDARIAEQLAMAASCKEQRILVLLEIERVYAARDFANLKALLTQEQLLESEWNRFKINAEREEANLRGPRADLAAQITSDARARELQKGRG